MRQYKEIEKDIMDAIGDLGDGWGTIGTGNSETFNKGYDQFSQGIRKLVKIKMELGEGKKKSAEYRLAEITLLYKIMNIN